MTLTSRLFGGTMGFAHLAGIVGSPGKKAKGKARAADDQDDEGTKAQDDEDDTKAKKAKKAKGRAEEDEDKPDASEDEDDTAASDDDDDTRAEGDDEGDERASDEDPDDEDEAPRGRRTQGSRSTASASEFARGRNAERKRCAAIFASPHAAKNIPQAAELAFNTTLSADRAIGILRTAGAGGGGSRSRVNPDLGSDADRGERAAQGAGRSWGSAIDKAGVKSKADGGWGGAVQRASR